MPELKPTAPAAAGRRRITVVLVVFGLLAVAVPIAWASHLYTDVPDSNPFHGDISAIQYAGITGGKTCDPPGTPPTYCPQEPISREAMAAFVHRGLSRTAFDKGGPLAPVGFADTTIASITLDVGGIPGGTQTVKLDAVIRTLLTSPVPVTVYIWQDGVGAVSQIFEAPGNSLPASPLVAVASVPAGTSQTFRLVAHQVAGPPGQASAAGSLAAITAAFGSGG